MALNLWEIHFSRDLRTCSSTLFLHPSSSPPWGPAHNLQRSRPGLSSLPPSPLPLHPSLLSSPLLSPSLSKNPLLLYSFLSRTLMNFRDKHTNLLYKNMAAVHVTLPTVFSPILEPPLFDTIPCDVHFPSFSSFASFLSPIFQFFTRIKSQINQIRGMFATLDKRTCNYYNL